MNKVYLCAESENYTRFDQVSEDFIQALIVSEDIQFFKHSGFEWDEIKNSALKNIKSFKFKRGGSTITQQLVKNVFLSNEKSIVRKIKEAYITSELEKKFKKNFILEKYINVIELGPQIFGIYDASMHYFNTTPSELTTWQSIFLVYLLPNPKVYSEVFNTKELTDFTKSRLTDLSKKLYYLNRIPENDYKSLRSRIESENYFNYSGGLDSDIDFDEEFKEFETIEPIEPNSI